jgi:spermidine synthase
VIGDLKSVNMGSADDFLSYFVMGTRGMREFGFGGVLNTDDNLHLEFSAPMSMDVPTQGKNALALYKFREPLLPYLLPARGNAARAEQKEKWDRYLQAGGTYALAHVLFLRGGHDTPEFQRVITELDRKYPDYAPLRFLKGEVRDLVAMAPALIRAENFMFLNESGNRVVVEISAVKVRVGEERAAVVFVDNRTRAIYGQKYIAAKKEELEERVRRYADDVLSNLKSAYQKEAVNAAREGRAYPLAGTTIQKMKKIIGSKTGEA